MKNLYAKMYSNDESPIRDYLPTNSLPCSVIDLFRVADFVFDEFLTGNLLY